MKYTYTLYQGVRTSPLSGLNVKRVHICTRFDEISAELAKLLQKDSVRPWFIEVYDNLKNVWDCDLVTSDDLEGWQTARERDIWLDKPAATTPNKAEWKPFDEAESGIHLKEATAPDVDMRIRAITDAAFEAARNLRPIDTNVKTAVAIGKPKLSDVPTVGLFALGAAMSDGASKYGRYNWRSTEVTASVFYDAIMRHTLQWYSGEDHADDSKIHHLAMIMANCAIILDAQMYGVFRDDRYLERVIVPQKTWWMKLKEKLEG
jgi:hypothetical protein